MTQKELLYFEDAIGHIGNVSKILEESISKMENEELISFMQEEKEKHDNFKVILMEKLKEKANG